MVSVTAGSDTYGSVKKVGGTPVVTKFAMLNFIPLYPLVSFYYAGAGRETWAGVPFVFSVSSTPILGFPLARIDRLSVVMAYVRGAFGTLMVVGAFSIVGLVMRLSGGRMDDFAMKMTFVLLGCLVVGVVGGALSYLVPLGVSERERRIRVACGGVLGLDADPALVRSDVARQLRQILKENAGLMDTAGGRSRRQGDAVDPALRLVLTRLEIALGGDREEREALTDRLLEKLDGQVTAA